MKEKLKIYIKDNYIKENNKLSLFGKNKKAKSIIYDEEFAESTSNVGSSAINNYINNNLDNKNFKDLLFNYIDSKNMKDSDVYNKVNIDRRLFSKIKCNDNYKPSKDTVILLSLSLELNINELDTLLNSANYSLSNNNISDLIIKFCFINHIYNINTINEYLYDYNCKTLN
ncbi:MAG: XRE family transcriptional regulator [Bacilli bacterium]|nr:XRE family transcriptional regulator [Bacilli bacterium]